jgi:hypothetical protein
MWLDNSSQDTVDLFWECSGEIEDFPRDLERAIALALPVALVKLPRLSLFLVEQWLMRRGAGFHFGCVSRMIRGCIVAYAGCGIIFIDATDPDDERRFTLAHEVAHFVTDYWLPRRAAIAKLGHSISEVLDGLRRPNDSERVHAFLIRSQLRVYSDLVERNSTNGPMNPDVWAIEEKADRIALGLLAPPEVVLANVDLSAPRFNDRHSAVTTALRDRFGLPRYIAASYAGALLSSVGLGPSWLEGIVIT